MVCVCDQVHLQIYVMRSKLEMHIFSNNIKTLLFHYFMSCFSWFSKTLYIITLYKEETASNDHCLDIPNFLTWSSDKTICSLAYQKEEEIKVHGNLQKTNNNNNSYNVEANLIPTLVSVSWSRSMEIHYIIMVFNSNFKLGNLTNINKPIKLILHSLLVESEYCFNAAHQIMGNLHTFNAGHTFL